jgi:hypothetical protein
MRSPGGWRARSAVWTRLLLPASWTGLERGETYLNLVQAAYHVLHPRQEPDELRVGLRLGRSPEHERSPRGLRGNQAFIPEFAQGVPDCLRGAAVLRRHRGVGRKPVTGLVAAGLDLASQLIGDLQVRRPRVAKIRYWHSLRLDQAAHLAKPWVD